MLRLSASLALSVLALFGVPLPPAAQAAGLTGRPIVIFVHGRDQMWETGPDLESRWFSAFEDGLEKLSPDVQSEPRFRALVPATDRTFVRYERVYEPDFQISNRCGGVRPNPAGILASEEFERAVALEQLRRSLATNLPASDTGATKRAVASADHKLGQFENAAVRLSEARRNAAGAETAALTSVVSGILHKMRAAAVKMFGVKPGFAFAKDASVYLEKGGHYCETNLRLQLALEKAASLGRPIVIVGHSMGAMVSLDDLWHSSSATYNVVRFVSLGAQLGMPELLRYLIGAGATQPLLPPMVADWVNIKGNDDLLGFIVNPESVQFIRGGPVINKQLDTGTIFNAHSISRYLQLRTTAHVIADAYCRAFQATIRAPAECQRVPKFVGQ